MAKEYVIIGNDALMKCSIPSFVADMVRVISWHDNQGNHIGANDGKQLTKTSAF